jgi:hypothetical protein
MDTMKKSNEKKLKAQECGINNKQHPPSCGTCGLLATRCVLARTAYRKLCKRMHIISRIIKPVFKYAAPDLVGGQDPAIASWMATNNEVGTAHSELVTNII